MPSKHGGGLLLNEKPFGMANKHMMKLGYESLPFKAKFPGTCSLSGVKIQIGDLVVFYSVPGTPKQHAVCHVPAVNYHIWFPWKHGDLSIEAKIAIVEVVAMEREKAKV
jgi:hypothetical protein